MKEQPHYQPDQIPAPHQRGEGIRGVPPPLEQKIVYTQEHYDRDQQEKSQLRHRFIRSSDDDGEKWKTIGWNRGLFKQIREIERRQKRYIREQEKKEKEKRRAARLERKALPEADAAERTQSQSEPKQIFPSIKPL
jgi:hypothetical protein